MNKNKKIIAFICAIAMVFSVFAAFTVTTSAASDKGIVLEYDKEASTTTKIVVNAKYVGVDELKAYSIRVNVPEGVTIDNLAFDQAEGIAAPSAKVLNNGVYGVAGASAEAFKNADKMLGTVTITLSAPMASNFKMSLANNSELTFTDNSVVGVGPSYSGDEEMAVATLTVPKDPNEEVKNPLPKPPTTDPEENPLPETKDPIVTEGNKGIVLEYDSAASSESKLVVVAKYYGVDELKAYSIRVNVPEGVTIDNLAFDQAEGIAAPSAKVLNNGVYGVAGASAEAFKNADKVLGTITITLPNALTTDFMMELANNSELTFTDNSVVGVGPSYSGDELMQTAWVKVPAGAAESMDNKKPLIDDGSNGGLVSAPAGELSENAYAALEVKKADGSPAVYGEDYVAYYNGEKLTKEQLDNLLAGAYCASTGKSLIEMLKGVEIQYNKGITGTLQIVDGEDVVADGDITSGTPSKPTQAPSTPARAKVSITQASISVRVGNVAKVNPVVKVGTTTIKGATFRFAYEQDLKLDENGEPTKADKDKYDKAIDSDKTYFDFVGEFAPAVENTSIVGIKTTSSKDIYVYLSDETQEDILASYEDVTEADVAEPLKVKVSVTKAASGSSGSSGSSSSDDDDDDGNGPIAGPATNPTNPSIPSIGVDQYYIDIDATPWAVNAINGLTAKGLLAGYGDRVFKPNNNVTRAEFATMIAKVFNVPAASNGQQFLDVAPVDWFYNSVQACAAAGIVSGYGDGYYDPNRTIDRQDMAVMVYRAARNCGKSDYLKPIVAERVFVDEYAIADYAKEAVKVLQMAGIISGMSETEYCPVDKATRAQSAVMLYPFSN